MHHRLSANVLAFLLTVSAASAEQNAPNHVPAPPSAAVPNGPEPQRFGGITFQGSLRSRFEGWQWFEADTGDSSYAFSGNLLRVSLSREHKYIDWQLEFAMPFLLGLPTDALAPGAPGQLGLGATYFVANDRSRNTALPFAKQGFVRFRRGLHALRLGRFEFSDGSETVPKNPTLAAIKRDRIVQRLIGNFAFSHVQRSIDGVHYQHTQPGGTFTFVGGRPTRGVFQTDGWGELNAAVGYAAYTKPWGTKSHSAETRILGIYYDDWRRIVKTDSRSAAARAADLGNIRILTFGGHHLSAWSTVAGTLDFLAWGVGQVGRWGLLDHRAYSFDLEAGIQPRVLKKLKPWLRAGYTVGSGDGSPSDGKHTTFFQILPTPRPFARFPFFNMQNMDDLMGALILRPHKSVTISSEFHALSLANKNDLWYSGGGAYQPWTFGYTGRPTGGAHSLANLYDTSVEYRFRPRITFTGYGGFADGRAGIEAIYPKGKRSFLGFLEIIYRF